MFSICSGYIQIILNKIVILRMDGCIYIHSSFVISKEKNKEENNDYHWSHCIASQLVRDRIIKKKEKKKAAIAFILLLFLVYKGIDRSLKKRGLDTLLFRLSRRRSLSCALKRK